MYAPDGKINKNASLLCRQSGAFQPYQYTTQRNELLGAREGAWLGVPLSWSPVYDIYGPDAVKLLNKVCVNRDFAKLKIGKSRHAILCHEGGQMLADGVLLRKDENRYRSYWLAPVLAYYVDTMGMDVKGEWVFDEFFIQLDGPRSLEIAEAAANCDIHDLKFAQNKEVTIAGKNVVIHRLGMSECLAYELHGRSEDVEDVYEALLEAGQDKGIRQLGQAAYCRNHTSGGYPNQGIHFWYAYMKDEGFVNYVKAINNPFFNMYIAGYPFAGSAADDYNNGLVTPFDIKWGYLVNFDHDFIGKEALLEASQKNAKTVVTLEWDAAGVGAAFAKQFEGHPVDPRDDISPVGDGADTMFATGFPLINLSKVMDGDKQVGVAVGRTHDYYYNTMVSLAYIDPAYDEVGKALTVIWGNTPGAQTEIKAKVARFPYFDGDFRNETCDVDKMVPRR